MTPFSEEDRATAEENDCHKPTTSLPHEMAPPKLAARCQNSQPDASHEPFCFELFHRAIVEGCSLSWHYLHNQYYRLVRYWVCQRTSADPNTVEDLTQDAFGAFWRFYTREKLAEADELGSVLSYLKSCAASAVAQAHRKANRQVPTALWDPQVVDDQVSTQSTEKLALRELRAEQVWEAVVSCCKNEKERIVARSTFVAGLKPRHIAERFPGAFPDVNEVYRVKRNLLARLRRDPFLQRIRKNEPDDHLM
jgi:RNA polymerase sigma factor (sigma-70 family)